MGNVFKSFHYKIKLPQLYCSSVAKGNPERTEHRVVLKSPSRENSPAILWNPLNSAGQRSANGEKGGKHSQQLQ